MSQGFGRVDADPESIGKDLGRLVLTIIELLRQLMERQALRQGEAQSRFLLVMGGFRGVAAGRGW